MLSKEEVTQVLAWLGGRSQYQLSISVSEEDASKVLAKVKSAGFAGFLRQSPGIPYEVVVTGRLDGDS